MQVSAHCNNRKSEGEKNMRECTRRLLHRSMHKQPRKCLISDNIINIDIVCVERDIYVGVDKCACVCQKLKSKGNSSHSPTRTSPPTLFFQPERSSMYCVNKTRESVVGACVKERQRSRERPRKRAKERQRSRKRDKRDKERQRETKKRQERQRETKRESGGVRARRA